VLCTCHVLNSYLLEEVKQWKAIKLLALAKGVVDLFRIQAPHKIFLKHALLAEHSLALTATVLLLLLLCDA
jgi:hypothetical protein